MTDLTITSADPTSPRVRPLIAALDTYLAGLYPAESNHGLSIDDLCQENVHFVVAKRADAVVGCGALVLEQDFGEIKRMYVVPEARKGGVGRQLLAHLEKLADDAGRPMVRLETGVDQPEALALYRHAGYARTGPFGGYRHDPLSVFMEKPLARPMEDCLGRAASFP